MTATGALLLGLTVGWLPEARRGVAGHVGAQAGRLTPTAPPYRLSPPRVACCVSDDTLAPLSPPAASSALSSSQTSEEGAVYSAPDDLDTDGCRVPPLKSLSHEQWLQAASTQRASGGWRAAERVARDALCDAPPPRTGVGERVPVHALFLGAMEACVEAGQLREALGLLDSLEASGRPGGTSEYSAVMRGCWKARDWSSAVELVHRARSGGRATTCTIGVYALAIAACEDAGKDDDALSLYALGVEDGAFHHWHKDEPFSLDLHGFTCATAACAVRYVLTREVGNYLPSDLKIITGAGRHSEDGNGVLAPRIQRLLEDELSPPLPYELAERLVCDSSGCRVIQNDGCLVVSVQNLFKWLVDAKPFESYYINLPGQPA